MVELSLLKAVIIFVVTGIVTFIGAGTGGSAMFTVPLCIFLGLPVSTAVATTRFSAFFSMLGAFAGFSKHKKIDYKIGIIGSVISCFGAYIGSSLLLTIPQNLAKKGMGVLMIILLGLSFLLKKNFKFSDVKISPYRRTVGYFLFFLTGCIGGAFGGQGILLVYTLTLFFGMDFLVAAGTRVIISFAITLISLIIYFHAGAVHWQYGCVMAVASLLGTYFGALYSVKKGEGVVEKIVEAIVVITSVKLLLMN